MGRVTSALAAALVLALAASGGAPSALGATIPRPGEDKDGIPKGWNQCPKCKRYHPPNAPHCPRCGVHHPPAWIQCSACKRCHPPEIPCPECPPPGFAKCMVEGCGTLFPKGRKCPNCARRTAPRRSATCPVCAKAFNGPLPFRINGRGGTDRDFCRHPLGREVIMSQVWMCPRCGHADWAPEIVGGKETPAEFNEKVSEDYSRKVQAEVQPEIRKLLVDEVSRISSKLGTMTTELDQTDIPDWIKYDAAYRCSGVRGESAAVRAKLALEASYACRRELVSAVRLPVLSRIIPAMEGHIAKRGGADEEPRSVVKAVADLIRASDQAAKENRPAVLLPPEKYYLYIRVSGCWDRLGEPRLAAEALEQALASIRGVGSPDGVLEGLIAVVGHRKALIEKEGAFRRAAIEHMRTAMLRDNAYPGASVAPTAYLLGELYRREGRPAQSRPWMTLASKIAASAGENNLLGNLIAEVMQLPAMKEARPDEKEEASALALLARLTGRPPEDLVDPVRPDPGPETVGTGTVTGKPKDCRELLTKLYAAYSAYVDKHGKAPEDLKALAAEEFISAEAACGFKCPDCGAELNYKPPRGLKSAEELLIWHPKVENCKRLLLRAGGKIEEM